MITYVVFSICSEHLSGYVSVEKDSTEYNMNHKRRGKAVILNHEEFDTPSAPARHGSHHDVKRLEMTYAKLGFEVVIYNNLGYQKIRSLVESCKHN